LLEQNFDRDIRGKCLKTELVFYKFFHIIS
jgi:hypothetical protein